MVTRGWNRYRNKSQHRKSTLEKKILPPFQQGFEPATSVQSRVRRSNHWAIPAPPYTTSPLDETINRRGPRGMHWKRSHDMHFIKDAAGVRSMRPGSLTWGGLVDYQLWKPGCQNNPGKGCRYITGQDERMPLYHHHSGPGLTRLRMPLDITVQDERMPLYHRPGRDWGCRYIIITGQEKPDAILIVTGQED